MKAGWFVRRPRLSGAHAVALTPERKLILVKLRYASDGARPAAAGGRANIRAAAIRELSEEIGMTAYGRVRFACELEEEVDFKRDLLRC